MAQARMTSVPRSMSSPGGAYLAAMTLMFFFKVLPFRGFIVTETTHVPLPTIFTVVPDTVQIRFNLEDTTIEIFAPLTDLIPAVFNATDEEIFLPTDDVNTNGTGAGAVGVAEPGVFGADGVLPFGVGTEPGLLEDPVGVTAVRDEEKDPPGCWPVITATDTQY